ncbi:hypothetical protein KUCAC02_004908, partial [Chaenocephalus aceratus]
NLSYFLFSTPSLAPTLLLNPREEEFIRGLDLRCCDSALNHRRPRRLLIRPQCDTATPSPTQLSCGIWPRAG